MQKIRISANLAWILVLLGGVVECFWVSGLKYADSFVLYLFTALGIMISFCCFILALKTLEVSITYTIFVGIGTAGVVLSEIFVFGEDFSLLKVLLISLLIFSIIGLKLVSKEKDKAIKDSLSPMNETREHSQSKLAKKPFEAKSFKEYKGSEK